MTIVPLLSVTLVGELVLVEAAAVLLLACTLQTAIPAPIPARTRSETMEMIQLRFLCELEVELRA